MCLAVPAQIIELDGANATVDVLGTQQRASTRLIPAAQVGDYILVHAGFGIQVIDPAEAAETLELIANMPELIADDLPDDVPDPFAPLPDPAAEPIPVGAMSAALAQATEA